MHAYIAYKRVCKNNTIQYKIKSKHSWVLGYVNTWYKDRNCFTGKWVIHHHLYSLILVLLDEWNENVMVNGAHYVRKENSVSVMR